LLLRAAVVVESRNLLLKRQNSTLVQPQKSKQHLGTGSKVKTAPQKAKQHLGTALKAKTAPWWLSARSCLSRTTANIDFQGFILEKVWGGATIFFVL
jgi:hypothetical protein